MTSVENLDDNRRAWEIANRKYVVESEAFVSVADKGTLLPLEVDAIAPLLKPGSVVVHLQSGNGTEDPALSRLAGSTVIGVDFSAEAATSAQHRACALGSSVRYVVGEALRVPLACGSVDLVYTGKGALMWLAELSTWAAEVVRLLRPGGSVFLYEAHPCAALWTRDTDEVRVRSDRSYFGEMRPNDTFPASAIMRFAPEPASKRSNGNGRWPLSSQPYSMPDSSSSTSPSIPSRSGGPPTLARLPRGPGNCRIRSQCWRQNSADRKACARIEKPASASRQQPPLGSPRPVDPGRVTGSRSLFRTATHRSTHRSPRLSPETTCSNEHHRDQGQCWTHRVLTWA